jgi:hypothetical protein
VSYACSHVNLNTLCRFDLISWFVHIQTLLVVAASLGRKYIRLIVCQSVSQVEKNDIYVHHRFIHSSFRSSFSIAFVASNSLSPTLPSLPSFLPSILPPFLLSLIVAHCCILKLRVVQYKNYLDIN